MACPKRNEYYDYIHGDLAFLSRRAVVPPIEHPLPIAKKKKGKRVKKEIDWRKYGF